MRDATTCPPDTGWCLDNYTLSCLANLLVKLLVEHLPQALEK